MRVIVERKASKRVGFIATLMAVFALVAQPLYGVVQAEVARAMAITDQVVINEVDSYGGSDKVELYNPTPGAINISNWSLKDSSTNIKDKDNFSNTTIPSGGYVTVIFGNSLNKDGDIVSLYTQPGAVGEPIDTVKYGGSDGVPTPTEGKTVGRTYDASQVWSLMAPSIGGTNNPSSAEATRYVKVGSGDDAGKDCTDSANPCSHLTTALSVADAGDTIDVDGGTQSGHFEIDKKLHLVGRNGAELSYSGSDYTVEIREGASGTSITGFEIENTSNKPALKIEAGSSLTSGLNISNNIFTSHGNGHLVSGGNLADSAFADNIFNVDGPTRAVYIERAASTGNTFSGNIFVGSTDKLTLGYEGSNSIFANNNFTGLNSSYSKIVEIKGSNNTESGSLFGNGQIAINLDSSNFQGVYGTITDAIKVAAEGDTVSVSAGEYSGNISVDKGLTLKGVGDATKINGKISINATTDVALSNFALTYGDTVAIKVPSTVSLDSLTLDKLKVDSDKAIYIADSKTPKQSTIGTLTITDSQVWSNYALFVDHAVDDVIITGNIFNITDGNRGIVLSNQLSSDSLNISSNKFIMGSGADSTSMNFVKYEPASRSLLETVNSNNEFAGVTTAISDDDKAIVAAVDSSDPVMHGYKLSNYDLRIDGDNPTLTGITTDDQGVTSIKYAIFKYVDGKRTSVKSWTGLPAADGTSYGEKTVKTERDINLKNLPEGVYEFSVRAWDAANNKTNGGDLLFRVDNTSPIISIKDGYIGDKTAKVFSQVSFKLYDKYKVDRFTLNGHEYDRTANQWSDANFQNIKNRLNEGENTFVLYDVAGNNDTYEFTYDSAVPEVTLDGAADGQVGDYPSYKVSQNVTVKVSDTNRDVTEVYADGGVEAVQTYSSTTEEAFTLNSGLREGRYYIVHTDKAENESDKVYFVISRTAATITDVEGLSAEDFTTFNPNRSTPIKFRVTNNGGSAIEEVLVRVKTYDESKPNKWGGGADIFSKVLVSTDGIYEVDLTEIDNSKLTQGGEYVILLQARNTAKVHAQKYFNLIVDNNHPFGEQIVRGENFNTHQGDDYEGISVGFSVEDFRTPVSRVKVELTREDGSVVTKESNQGVLELINNGTSDEKVKLTTPFVISEGEFTEQRDLHYWQPATYRDKTTEADWSVETKPKNVKVSIYTEDSDEPAAIVTMGSENDEKQFTDTPPAHVSYASLLPQAPAPQEPVEDEPPVTGGDTGGEPDEGTVAGVSDTNPSESGQRGGGGGSNSSQTRRNTNSSTPPFIRDITRSILNIAQTSTVPSWMVAAATTPTGSSERADAENVLAQTDEREIDTTSAQSATDNDLVDENEEAGFLAGVAWYWWPVIAVVVAGLLWWLITTMRRSESQ